MSGFYYPVEHMAPPQAYALGAKKKKRTVRKKASSSTGTYVRYSAADKAAYYQKKANYWKKQAKYD